MADKWMAVGKVKSSTYRAKILYFLAEGIKTPNELKEAAALSMPHTSRALKELMEEKLVICKNPKAKKGRLYEITRLGREVLKLAGKA